MKTYEDELLDEYYKGQTNGFNAGYVNAITKAIEWLYQRQAVDLEVSDIEKFIEDFKNYMKGE